MAMTPATIHDLVQENDALRAKLEAAERDVRHLRYVCDEFKERADAEYCRGLDIARSTPCLGLAHKMAHGTFGPQELAAHVESGKADARHRALYWAIEVLDAALAKEQPRAKD